MDSLRGVADVTTMLACPSCGDLLPLNRKRCHNCKTNLLPTPGELRRLDRLHPEGVASRTVESTTSLSLHTSPGRRTPGAERQRVVALPLTSFDRTAATPNSGARNGHLGATPSVRHRGEARIAQKRAVLPQKPGTASSDSLGRT